MVDKIPIVAVDYRTETVDLNHYKDTKRSTQMFSRNLVQDLWMVSL